MGVTRAIASAAVLLTAVGAAEAAVPGAAQAAGAATNARTIRLVLTVAKGESTVPAQQRASLTCQPAGGSHKQARTACAELAKVGGRFDRLQLAGGACTMVYDPVTVTASGRWKGRKVAYQHTFGNACTLTTTTGAVFSF
ncbi:SSI family serine proteinase inhibitor [Dactylosporangium sp. NPDC051541]|uniref:SSI family serine proteinase inhibitor n=1 Tax=Dactylosporangium sp. NPDC051541 TaxID=3363977 RepID=UPI0037B4B722